MCCKVGSLGIVHMRDVCITLEKYLPCPLFSTSGLILSLPAVDVWNLHMAVYFGLHIEPTYGLFMLLCFPRSYTIYISYMPIARYSPFVLKEPYKQQPTN